MTRSAWIPYAFIAGFAVVLSANGALIYAATRQKVSLVVEKPYERGLDYNRLLAEQHRQQALGWSVKVAVDGGALSVTATAADHEFADAVAEVTLQRPIEGDRIGPFPVLLVKSQGRLPIDGARPGQWTAHVILHVGADRQVSDHRLVLP
ncbi:FixH family protein [Lacibacterium aquatile]|uniref:FixH family protein n=1 Tax=Lacibacterium aquatile TaxID=1168082 RepID=A0ABW5DW87_9PROT